MNNELQISIIVHNPLWKVRLRPYTKTVRAVLEAAAQGNKSFQQQSDLVFPPPLRGRVREGGANNGLSSELLPPTPPSPARVEGEESKKQASSYPTQKLEVAVVLADDAFVQQLNKDYRGKNAPTNVLSFPNDEQTGELGDIILALETIEREATAQGKKFRDHAAHLLVHGFLHLLGYDHIKDAEAEVMEKKEIKILQKLAIANPYL